MLPVWHPPPPPGGGGFFIFFLSIWVRITKFGTVVTGVSVINNIEKNVEIPPPRPPEVGGGCHTGNPQNWGWPRFLIFCLYQWYTLIVEVCSCSDHPGPHLGIPQKGETGNGAHGCRLPATQQPRYSKFTQRKSKSELLEIYFLSIHPGILFLVNKSKSGHKIIFSPVSHIFTFLEEKYFFNL